MRIERIELRSLVMPLRAGFETSFGRVASREMVIVALHADRLVGWGEAPVADRPHYSPETASTAMDVLAHHMAPAIVGRGFETPGQLLDAIAFVRGHHMARAALEWAWWDLDAKRRGISLAAALGAERERVPVGVSLGIPAGDDLGALLAEVHRRVEQGYHRVKLKIRPGFSREPVAAVRERWPELALCVDGNGGFRPEHTPELAALDPFDLLFIEQPLAHDDLLEHARLRRRIATPICLDESLSSPAALDAALALGSLDVINLKSGRVGGVSAARSILRTARERRVELWCGGMLETGIGRAAHVALAACPGFTQPGDLSASERYYEEDLVEPAFTLDADGCLRVPDGPGIGVEVRGDRLERATRRHLVIEP
ncbi:MAG: o-succinylbenzoate synthase [Planctomycetota bacterium]|nr:MAG: o-succinylbenzoate synthase [Planctomycetota bacterium]